MKRKQMAAPRPISILSSFCFFLSVLNTHWSLVNLPAIKCRHPTPTTRPKTLPGHLRPLVVKGLIVVRAKQAAVKCDLLRCDATGPFLSARNSAEYVDVYEWLLMAYATSVTAYYGSPFNAGGESP